MKKILSLVSALALSALAFATTSVTMDFANPADYGYAAPEASKFTQVNDGQKIAKDNVELTVKFTSGSGFRFYNSSGKINLRGYVGATLTIAPPSGKKVLKIKISGSNLNTTYLAEAKTGKDTIFGTSWEGEADVVTMSVIKSTVQINNMTVEYGDAGETPSVTKVDTIGVSQAIARINAGNKGECYVKGVVAGDPFTLGNNGPAFYMTDIANAADSLEGFKIGKDANTPYADADAMAKDFGMGDTILIYAAGLDKYNSIFETTSGYFCKVLGKSSAVTLDWAVGSAVLTETGWDLEIAKANNDTKNLVNMKIVSTKKDGIKGQYPLAAGSSLLVGGSSTAILAGNIILNFKEIGPNSLNIYDVQATFNAGDKIYRIKQEVEFFATDANGDEIVLTGDRPYVPKEGEELTCAQAQEYAFSLASGATGDVSVVVKGYVTKIVDATTFWMDDAKGSKETFEAYKVKNFTPVGKEIALGSQVKLTGKVTNYNGKTAEIKDGSVEIIDGVDIQVTEATVAEALAACKALAQNASSTETYAITGFITSIAREFSDQYGNISFWMSDQAGDEAAEFQAYNVKCDATLAAKLVAGAKVKVTDKLKHFHQDAKPATDTEEAKPERTIYETVGGGSVELIQGAAVEVIRADAPAVKFIENGQIIIIRNGVRYNVQGQLAK